MVRKFFRKWWRLFLVAALLAAAVQFFVRSPGFFPDQVIGRIGTSLFRPVYGGIDFLRQGISSLWTGYIGLVNVSRQNRELRKEVADLREKLKESRDASLENRRLEDLLRFSKTLEKRTVGARVVGHDVSPWFQGIFINAGTAPSDASTGPIRASRRSFS
jgi:cell shape-determining protein MreC